MRYVLAISIGPVQEFIAAARKSRDLWFGSRLLSDVSRSAALALQLQNGELVFPPKEILESSASVANKIVAIVPDGGDPAAFAEEAEKAAKDAIHQAKDQAIGAIKKQSALAAIDQKLLESHIDDLLEFYAAWAPFSTDGEYSAARSEADRRLAGRKATRDFRQTASSGSRPKSSLDPGRETVLLENNGDLLERLQIKSGEMLDGISLVKRMAKERPFVSVSRVAMDPFIRALAGTPDLQELTNAAMQLVNVAGEHDTVRKLTGEFAAVYSEYPFDTQLIYDEVREDIDLPNAQIFRHVSHKAQRVLGLAEIPPYLAVLVADGDRMGAAISELEDAKGHRQLSHCLAGFAGSVNAIVRRHHGALLYSGGDDVVAFLPLDTALACADELRQAFEKALAPLELTARPTMSAGIAIGHFQSHLDSLLRWAREAEKIAKTDGGRNALAVTLRKRSAGEDCVSGYTSWTGDPVSTRWARWIELINTGALPANAIYKLDQLQIEMAGLEAMSVDIGVVLPAEIKRILEKSRQREGSMELGGKIVKEFVEIAGKSSSDLRAVVNELRISRPIAASQRIATGSEPVYEVTTR